MLPASALVGLEAPSGDLPRAGRPLGGGPLGPRACAGVQVCACPFCPAGLGGCRVSLATVESGQGSREGAGKRYSLWALLRAQGPPICGRVLRPWLMGE